MNCELRTGLEVRLEEGFDRGGGSFFIRAFDVHADGITLLDPHSHEGHQFQGIDGFFAFDHGDGGRILLDFLHKKAGGAGMDPDGIGNGCQQSALAMLMPADCLITIVNRKDPVSAASH